MCSCLRQGASHVLESQDSKILPIAESSTRQRSKSVSQAQPLIKLLFLFMSQQQETSFHYNQVSNIKNPSAAKTITNLEVQTFNSSTLLDSTTTATITYAPITLPTSDGSLVSANPTVGVYAALTVTLKVGTALTSGSQVIITFPKWEQSSLGQSSPGSMIDSVSAVTSTGESPTFTTSISSSATGTDTITISGLFTNSGGLAAGSSFTLAITNVRNPPTMQPYNSISVMTADSSGDGIEQCGGLGISITTPGSLNSATRVQIQSNAIVNQKGTYFFLIIPTDPVPEGGWIKVILPSQLSVSTSSLTVTSMTPSSISSSPTVSVSGQTITIKNAVIAYIDAQTAFSFELGGIQNPSTSQTTSSFEIFTYDESSYEIDQLTSGLQVSASLGTLTNVKINPVNVTGVLQYATNYSVQFTIANALNTGTSPSIIITFDSSELGFQVGSSTCYVIGLDSGYTCLADAYTNTITITNFLYSSVTSGKTFKFTIYDLYVRNPPTTKASPAIFIATAQNGSEVDSSDSAVVYPTPTIISSVSISPSSQVTSATDVTYVFTIDIAGFLLTTTYIQIQLPSQVSIYSPMIVNQNCGQITLSGFENTTLLNCENFENNITIFGGFLKQITTNPVTLQFSVSGLQNPRSMKPSSTFVVAFYDGSESYPTFIKTNETFVTMTTAAPLKGVAITRTSEMNGQTCNYTFSLILSNTPQTNDYFILYTPSDGPSWNSNPQCFGQSSNLYPILSCSLLDSTRLQITLQIKSRRRFLQFISSSVTYTGLTIMVTNVKNPISLKPSSSLQLTQYDSAGYMVETQTSGVIVTNTIAGSISPSQFLIIPDNLQVNANTSYTFTFIPSNYESGMLLYLTFPSQIVMPNSTNIQCEAINGISLQFSCTYFPSNQTLLMKNAFPFSTIPSNIQFKISPVINPSQIMVTSSFEINTFTNNYYSLDSQNQTLVLNMSCILPCKQCVQTDATKCSACFSPSDTEFNLTERPYLANEMCFASCPSGTYDSLKSYQCGSCYSDLCATCTGPDMGECTICLSNAALINGNCVKYLAEAYFMPFLILAVLWTVFVFTVMIDYDHGKTLLVPSLIVGYSFLENMLVFVEIGVYVYFNFEVNLYITIAGGILLNLSVNLAFMAAFFITLRKSASVQNLFKENKKTDLTVMILGFSISSRFFKLLYSRLGGKKQFNMNRDFLKESKARKVYFAVHYLSLGPTLIMFVNACYNLALSSSLQVVTTTLIDVERLILSSLVIFLLIIEFLPQCDQRPQCLQKLVISRMKKKMISEKYKEIAYTSNYTQNGHDYEQEMRIQAMRKLLKNLRSVKPQDLDQKISEMLAMEEAKQAEDQKGHQR